MTTPHTPRELARGLYAVTEDALFGVAAAGYPDEEALVGLGKRRADVYRSVVRGETSKYW